MQISKSATKTKQIVPYFEEINKIKQPSTVSKEGLVSRLLNEKENEPTEDILKKIDMIIQEPSILLGILLFVLYVLNMESFGKKQASIYLDTIVQSVENLLERN